MKKNVSILVYRTTRTAATPGVIGGLDVDYASGTVTTVDENGTISAGDALVFEGRALMTPPRYPRSGAGQITTEGEPIVEPDALLILPRGIYPAAGDRIQATARGHVQHGVILGFNIATGAYDVTLDTAEPVAVGGTA